MSQKLQPENRRFASQQTQAYEVLLIPDMTVDGVEEYWPSNPREGLLVFFQLVDTGTIQPMALKYSSTEIEGEIAITGHTGWKWVPASIGSLAASENNLVALRTAGKTVYFDLTETVDGVIYKLPTLGGGLMVTNTASGVISGPYADDNAADAAGVLEGMLYYDGVYDVHRLPAI